MAGGAVVHGGCKDGSFRGVNACWEDHSIESLRNERLVILHARMASKGAVRLSNVHPFAVAVNGEQWSFCHNGTVRQELALPSTLENADSTDSESLFHQLLPYVVRRQVLEGIQAVYGAISNYTSLNTFLLGPTELWVVCLYTEMPNYYTLHLSTTGYGPVVSSERLPELDTEPVPLANGQILRVDRNSGHIDEFTL